MFTRGVSSQGKESWRKEAHGWEGGEGGLWCSPPSRRWERWGKVRDGDGWRELIAGAAQEVDGEG